MYLVAAKSRGLTLEDLGSMTFGQVMDFIVTYNNINTPDEDKPNRRLATQADWDKF